LHLVFVVKASKFDREDLVRWMKLSLVHGVGPKRMLQLSGQFESVEGLFNATPERLLMTGVLTPKMIKDFERLKAAADENYFSAIEFCTGQNIRVVPLISEEYPRRLLSGISPPKTLFLWGDTSLLEANKTLAIVGSRSANETMRKFAYTSAKILAEAGFAIVSGGATGIDTEAHRGAIDTGGKTICVMGTGFSNFYPQENQGLFERIRERGLLVSEHLPNFPGDRISFLQRNRITSGLSDGLLFCSNERLNSGTATQVRIAHKQKIPIYCPNRELSGASADGIVDAISEYGAKEIRNAEEIVELMKNKEMRNQTLTDY
jgi:DNA processing protein